MKNSSNYWVISIIFIWSWGMWACETDDDPIPQQFESTFPILEVDGSGVMGEITFFKESETSTRIIIELLGTHSEDQHPARIHSTSPDLEGPMVLELNPIDGQTGRSETLVSPLADGSPGNYEEWVGFDGYVLVFQDMLNLNTHIAIGLLGENIPNIPGG